MAKPPMAYPGKRSRLDHLIDEAAETGRIGIGFAAAGINLQLLLAERRLGVARIVIERSIDRHAVVLVSNLIVVAAANVDGLIDSDLIGRDVRARHRGNRRVRVVQAAAAVRASPRRS